MLLVMVLLEKSLSYHWKRGKEIVTKVAMYAKGKLPVFFGSSLATTQQTIEFAQYAEKEGADGLVL